MDGLRSLSRPAMETLADGFESGRIDLSRSSVSDLVPGGAVDRVVEELRALLAGGASGAAAALRALAAERTAAETAADRYEVVWSGGGGPEARNTAIVVQQLFRTVRRRLL